MNLERRNFIKTSATMMAGASILTPNIIFGKDDRKVRMAFVGLGGRGRGHMQRCLQRDDVEVISKYLDECEGMEDIIDKIIEILKKLDRVKWITNYNGRLCKDFEG